MVQLAKLNNCKGESQSTEDNLIQQSNHETIGLLKELGFVFEANQDTMIKWANIRLAQECI